LKLKRLLSTGVGVLFKGSGFYETDYRSEGYKKAAQSDKPVAATTSETKTPEKKETKPATTETKTESKPAPKKKDS
jgi:predicted nucleic acid-binding Zn ribbon protein